MQEAEDGTASSPFPVKSRLAEGSTKSEKQMQLKNRFPEKFISGSLFHFVLGKKRDGVGVALCKAGLRQTKLSAENRRQDKSAPVGNQNEKISESGIPELKITLFSGRARSESAA